jgi:hypothetical protein
LTWHGHLGRDAARAEPVLSTAKECPCHILSDLRDPTASRAAKAEALKFVVHFVGDLHQPLHDEDNGDRGGNERQAIFNGRPDNLHWVWDTGLLVRLGRDPDGLARRLEKRITAEEVLEWQRGTVLQWANEAHGIARAVAYGQLAKGRHSMD